MKIKNQVIISVVIPAYNDHSSLRKNLDSLSRQLLSFDYFEVIVVDNGSDPPLQDIVEKYPFARYILETTPGSYAARNTGIKNCLGQLIAFTDADCVPFENWLSEAIRHFENDPEIDALGGRVELTLSENCGAAEIFEKVYGFRQEYNVNSVGYSVTANLIVRKSVLHQVGPFNAQLFSGGDREWGLRAKQMNIHLIYADDVAVNHPARASITELLNKHRRIVGGKSMMSQSQNITPTHVLKSLIPPIPVRRSIHLLSNHHQIGISFFQAVQTIGLLALVTATNQIERLRLLLGGAPKRK